ncbi:conserved hypothetical protein [Pediculus humanus corporis]|uniref:Centrosomal protein CEP104 N-terminal domain-containing protein n=1 Tax=Pediculus humanus subsp. corporis TaxID=121224 RepID=E0VZR4_PEDHC|nr:uncharacterized protein Phum_PHUM537420 [Pediculus humanus corporis]EEB18870.1 conserved hypothetical protein [Pediculus humanus corporis]
MPVKIGFQVIFCSGEDKKYRVNELNYHGPTVRGWRSSINCTFPQEIILKLEILAILHQIQILSHQYLIPQKIEICISSKSEYEVPTENSLDLFEYLGYITFSDNKAAEYRSRELKSITIPSKKAKYIKLKIYENHVNVKNIFNQENFEYANTLKAALENLRAAGEIIGLYEQEKKQAILLEDYDKAKYKKIQIDNFRRKKF